MDIAHGIAERRGLIEGLLFQLFVRVLVGLPCDGLEVVLVVIDGFFFEDTHAGRVAEELADNFALG